MLTSATVTAAIAGERHEQVRRILSLNAWKIKTWKAYAFWKHHARAWVSIEYAYRLQHEAALRLPTAEEAA